MERKIGYIVVISLLLLSGFASLAAATNPEDNGDESKLLQVQVFVFGRFFYAGEPGNVPGSDIIELPRGCIYWIRVTSDGEPVGGAKVTLIERFNDGTVLGRNYKSYYTSPYGFVRSFIIAPKDVQDDTVYIISASKSGYTGRGYILNFYY